MSDNHPLSPLFGKYRDDPSWEDFERGIEENREPCQCGHGRLWHTFAPGDESLCDLCGCEHYLSAPTEHIRVGTAEAIDGRYDIRPLQDHERRPEG